ncbi:MAG: DUF4276 family protein [Methanomicrobiales archaeon]|nr:DUF4276 family protein [Methanomicrobiales archaeon]
MASRTLYVLLEGNDDERFFRTLLKPYLERRYRKIKFWKYARERRKNTLKFIRSLRRMEADFIFVRDIDMAPSVREKKQEIAKYYEDAIPDQAMMIVVMEIESWYLAGSDTGYFQERGIRLGAGSTDDLTKEMFNQLIPPRMSRIEFLNEILQHYSLERGVSRNTSFRYFVEHWIRIYH